MFCGGARFRKEIFLGSKAPRRKQHRVRPQNLCWWRLRKKENKFQKIAETTDGLWHPEEQYVNAKSGACVCPAAAAKKAIPPPANLVIEEAKAWCRAGNCNPRFSVPWPRGGKAAVFANRSDHVRRLLGHEAKCGKATGAGPSGEASGEQSHPPTGA